MLPFETDLGGMDRVRAYAILCPAEQSSAAVFRVERSLWRASLARPDEGVRAYAVRGEVSR